MAQAIETDTAQRLRRVVGRLTRLLRPTDAGAAAELTPTRVAVLLATVRSGQIRLADIAAQEGLNPTLLSRTVASLVDAGLVARRSDEVDRRSAWLEPTEAGTRVAKQVLGERTHAVEAALLDLSEGDRRLVEQALPALERLSERLAAGHAL